MSIRQCQQNPMSLGSSSSRMTFLDSGGIV